MREETLNDVISALRRSLTKLERFGAKDGRSLHQQVLDCLVDCGPLSSTAVARFIHRRRTDVLSTLKLMESAGQIVRRGEKWYAD